MVQERLTKLNHEIPLDFPPNVLAEAAELEKRAAEGAADLGGLKPLDGVEDALPIDRVSKASTSKRQDLRGVPFVTIDGEDFSVNDVAYYYGSIYNTFANNGSSFGFDSSKSAREQQYTEGKTWHDYFLESALDYMKESVAVAHAAEAAGFDGAEQMDSAEQSNLSMVDLYASYSGATRAQLAVLLQRFAGLK